MGKTSDKTVYKTTGWCGFGSGSNTAAVDVKDGRIARIRPLHLDEKLDPKSNVYYLNLPKRWVAGQAIDPMADEVIIGATVTMQEEGTPTLSLTSIWQVTAKSRKGVYTASGFSSSSHSLFRSLTDRRFLTSP